jgi:hypothetical protein
MTGRELVRPDGALSGERAAPCSHRMRRRSAPRSAQRPRRSTCRPQLTRPGRGRRAFGPRPTAARARSRAPIGAPDGRRQRPETATFCVPPSPGVSTRGRVPSFVGTACSTSAVWKTSAVRNASAGHSRVASPSSTSTRSASRTRGTPASRSSSSPTSSRRDARRSSVRRDGALGEVVGGHGSSGHEHVFDSRITQIG